MSNNPKRGISDRAFCEQAKALRCKVAQIKAVAHVESRGAGFLPSGKPKILFERHKFYKYLGQKRGLAFRNEITKTHPEICYPSAGGYGSAGENQWRKFSTAFHIDKESAMLSASWGRFQVMGFNWRDLGYGSVDDFVNQIKLSEDNHLDSFVRFVKANGLADELRAGQWRAFASRYNGPAYEKNKYHTKMHDAFVHYSKEKIDCDALLSAPEVDRLVDEIEEVGPDPTETAPASNGPMETLAETPSDDDAPLNEAPSNTDKAGAVLSIAGYTEQGKQVATQVGDTLTQASESADKISKSSLWTFISTKASGLGTLLTGIWENNQFLIVSGVVLIILAVAYMYSSKVRATTRYLGARVGLNIGAE